ncbi:thiol:disulfide interchange protein precursor, partial [mine drainage metagenome]
MIYIGQQGSAVFGALALFVFGLGMGLPLLAFGTAAGALLPRAGGWMNTVKAVFGVLFLALAIWMLDRVLTPGWILALSGLLLLGCAVYLGVLQRLPAEAGGWRKLRMSLALILLLLGAAELAGA